MMFWEIRKRRNCMTGTEWQLLTEVWEPAILQAIHLDRAVILPDLETTDSTGSIITLPEIWMISIWIIFSPSFSAADSAEIPEIGPIGTDLVTDSEVRPGIMAVREAERPVAAGEIMDPALLPVLMAVRIFMLKLTLRWRKPLLAVIRSCI